MQSFFSRRAREREGKREGEVLLVSAKKVRCRLDSARQKVFEVERLDRRMQTDRQTGILKARAYSKEIKSETFSLVRPLSAGERT